MASFLQFFQSKEKSANNIEIKLSTNIKDIDNKILKLKKNLFNYSPDFDKTTNLKDIQRNKLNKTEKMRKRTKRKKKRNKYSFGFQRFKTKRNYDSIKKEIISNKYRLNKSLTNLKLIQSKKFNDDLMNFPKINQRESINIKTLRNFNENKNLYNDKNNTNEKSTIKLIEVNNSEKADKYSKDKNRAKTRKKVLSEKPKIIINESINDISSMNGGHTNNFTSKYLMEVSKVKSNALNGLLNHNVNDIFNMNIRSENKSISAYINNKQNENKIIKNNFIEEIKNERNEHEKNNFFRKDNIIQSENKKKYFIKNKTNIYFNIRNKRKEELEKRFVKVRKEYKDKEYDQSVQNKKTYIYLILPGNASYLIKNCMCHRTNWKEPFSSVTSLYNFKWQQISFGIDYNSLGNIINTKQLVNHFENHFALTNKANMFLNLMEYCEKRNISVFKYVPFTIIFQFKDKTNFENNKEIKKNEEKQISLLKNFINNYNNFIMNYENIGKYYQDEKYQKIQMKKYSIEFKKKKKLKKIKKEEDKKISDNDINNYENEIRFYHDYFKNIKLIEKIQKIKKDKEGNYEPVEENINENIGKKTLIEIPDTHISGNNLWIIKAINLNRGMCIKIVNTFEQIEETIQKFKEGVQFNFTRQNIESKYKDIFFKNISNDIELTEEDEKNIENKDKIYYCSRILIQKYIEKPLLYKKRKCDIRIWVLLTHSMKVYVFKEGHLKTCSIEYNLNSKNPFTHITNYSFQKYNNNFQKFEKGNEVPFYDFQKFLDENYPEKNYKLKRDLMSKIKEIIYLTMRSVKEKIDKNKRNYQFEIFGYDFMLDENFNVFLIEINTNPGLEESSPWIKIIVPRMLDDALRLTLDQLFEPNYDFKLNYKKPQNIEDLIGEINKKEEIKNDDIKKNNNKKYKSPFPVPGYELNENLWELVCDLNEADPLDELIIIKNQQTEISDLIFKKKKNCN